MIYALTLQSLTPNYLDIKEENRNILFCTNFKFMLY